MLRRTARRLPRVVVAAFLPLLALLVLVAPAAAAVATQTGLDGALAIAQAIAAPGTTVTNASFVTTTGGTPNGTSNAPLAGFGTAGSSFGILTTGNVSNVATPTAIANTNNGGGLVSGRGDTAKDISILRVGLNVPQGANCLTFDFKFLSTEYPGYVGTTYNDAFIAELDNSTWTTSGSTITATNNFAFDTSGKVVSVNSTGLGGMTAAQGVGTPFNGSRPYSAYGVGQQDPGNVGGATGLLRASKRVTPGSHEVFFSIFDQGDQLLDSAVFLDNLVAGFVSNPDVNCKPGAQPANFKLALAPATGTDPAGSAHTVTATLTDAATGNPVANQSIAFTVDGVNPATGTGTTNGSGQAAFTYTGANPGTDQIAACYQPTGATSCLAQASAQETWTASATTLTVATATGTYGGTATLSATLTQGGTPVTNQPVAFTLNGYPAGTATTGPDGVATLTPPTSLGTIGAGSYPGAIGANFVGSPGLLTSNGTGDLTVTPAPLTVTTDNTSKVYGQANPAFTASYSGLVNGDGPGTLGGTLTFATAATATSPVGSYDVTPSGLTSPNYAITFAKGTLTVTPAPATLVVNNATFTYDGTAKAATVTTTPNGLSVALTYNGSATAPTDAGSYAVVAHLTDPNYSAPDATGTLVINQASSVVTVTAANATYDGQPHGATAVATGAGGLNQPLTIISYSGRAGTIYPASTTPPTNAGSYTASASFGGDANHTGSQGSADFAIGKVPTTLVITSPTTLPLDAQGKVTVTAKLTTQSGTPLVGETVTFSAGGSTASGTTAANGVATASLVLPSEQYTLTANFVGDANYQPSQAQQTVIAYQLTRFVIWGGNAGGVATGKDYQFWGAQWAKQVTGGDYQANNSFKGYADILSADGKTWTASPGGSGNPPATVAPYIGVIVATHATKDGASTSGNVDRIVILKVDAPASYQPNPGHAGTGVLVATLP